MAAQAGSVLVIDDELDIREMIKLSLTLQGYQVFTAEGGERGIEIAREHENELDLIITDIKMPGMNGLELLERLNELVPHVGVIVVTGYVSPDAITRCEKLGAEEILRKPFTIPDFEKSIARYFEQRD